MGNLVGHNCCQAIFIPANGKHTAEDKKPSQLPWNNESVLDGIVIYYKDFPINIIQARDRDKTVQDFPDIFGNAMTNWEYPSLKLLHRLNIHLLRQFGLGFLAYDVETPSPTHRYNLEVIGVKCHTT